MNTSTATLTRTTAQFWRNGLDPRRAPGWLGAITALIGATITALAVKADWMWLGGGYAFALDPAHVMLACGGLALFIAGLSFTLPPASRRVGYWIFVAVAAVTVAAASDLTVPVEHPKPIQGKFAPDVEGASSKRGRRLEFLKSGQENLSRNATAKFLTVVLLAGAIGLVRLSSLDRAQAPSDQQPRPVTADTISMGRLLGLEVQLGLLVLLFRQFELVMPIFYHQICLLIFFGFLLHYLLPLQYRLPFFLFLSLSAIVFIFGFVQASWLIAIGLGLIGVCHLPVSFRLRVILLVLAGFALVELRVGWLHPLWGQAIWPVLASMFMFRLIVYLYSLQHRKATPGIWSSLSYFFLLPNVVFPLFPVVDYATFQRNYYDSERHLIHQRGLKWIFWGVIHLLLYRAAYYYFVIGPDEINSVTDLVRYLVSNFLLILKLSGQFHLVIGVLLLFGFNLPRIMNRYWWADSFTDFWRRANIYWRDFMRRVVFYPVYFRLQHWPATASLLFATAVVFLVTWALHGYQWFWLRGSFSMSGPDALFWALFGVLVAANTLYDAKAAGRKKAPTGQERSFRQIALHTLRIMGVFCVICVLWSIWISTSISDWVSLWSVPGLTSKDIAILAPALVAGVALAALGAIITGREELRDGGGVLPTRSPEFTFFVSATSTAGLVLVLLIVSLPPIYNRFGPQVAAVVHELRSEKLSRQDVNLIDRAYYENLTRVDRFNSELWRMYNKGTTDRAEGVDDALQKPKQWVAYIPTGDFLGVQLRPFFGSRNAPFHTNRWGMRDKDYEQKPAPRTCRIVLLGGSPEMNTRVLSSDDLYEAVLEERLNRENDHRAVNQYEILNFSAATYTALHRLAIFDTKALSFQPDILFYAAHPSDRIKAVYRLAEVVFTETPIPYDYLRQIVSKAGVSRDMSLRTIRARLQRYGNDIIGQTYRQIVELCRKRSIRPVFLYVPNVKIAGTALGADETPDHLRLAAEAGFQVVNLADIFDDVDQSSLHREDWDVHPNAKGQAIIAERIYEAVRKNPTLLQKTESSKR